MAFNNIFPLPLVHPTYKLAPSHFITASVTDSSANWAPYPFSSNGTALVSSGTWLNQIHARRAVEG